MLDHMIKVEILELVLSRVDLLVRVLEVALNHESGGIPDLGSGSVVRACVATLGLDVWDSAVFVDDLFDEGRKGWVNEVGNHSDGFGLAGLDCAVSISGHCSMLVNALCSRDMNKMGGSTYCLAAA